MLSGEGLSLLVQLLERHGLVGLILQLQHLLPLEVVPGISQIQHTLYSVQYYE